MASPSVVSILEEIPAGHQERAAGHSEAVPGQGQRTYMKTLDNAHRQYPVNEERAHRTAMDALKHSFERGGDRWQPKRRRGPSDPQAKQRGRAAREHPRKTYGGVDAEGNSKQELYERARKLGVEGRSRMTKGELAEAIASKQR